MSTYIGNVRITVNDTIKNWWKMGYFDAGLITRDNGDGDLDFYTYWYSIAYFIGMLNVYRRIFRDVETYEDILRRFFQSREIAIKNDDEDTILEYIFNNYVDDLNNRGTKLINKYKGQTNEVGISDYADTGVIADDIDNNAGIGVLSNANDLIGVLPQTINIGLYHSIEFDALFANVSDVPYTVNGGIFVESAINGIGLVLASGAGPTVSCTITYMCGGFSYNFVTDIDVTILNHIKFLRYESFVVLYINDIYIGKETLFLNDGNVYDQFNLDRLFSGQLPAVANLMLKKRDINFQITNIYSWVCQEGSGDILDSNQAPLNYAWLNITPSMSWGTVWRRSELFNNTGYVGVDGEVKRLVEYVDGENLLELINVSEMGWAMDISSPISEEASCVNLNKAYQKGVITDVSKFPVSFDTKVRPYISGGYIQFDLPAYNAKYYGLNIDLLLGADWRLSNNYKPLGQIPFIPINIATYDDDIDGYEISFVIKSSRNIRLRFGIATYDEDMNLLSGKTKRYYDDTNSNMFLESINFTLCDDLDVWVRGVYSLSKLTGVNNKLNINDGYNLYNDSTGEVKFIAPIIAFVAVGSYRIEVYIKDIVVRPLTLNTEKGIVRNKNRVVGYLKNNSGKSDTIIEDFIADKLIPYNCVTDIQFL